MEKTILNRVWRNVTDIFYSFPVQLVILHLRNNHLLLFTWILLGFFIFGVVAKSFGIHFLFLDPEYLGKVNFISFFILGMSFGAYYMSWNLTTYLLSTHYFPFLASLKKPFTKFCLNNAIIPGTFLILYFGRAFYFQKYYEYWPLSEISINLLSFLAGLLMTLSLYSLFFQFTNKDITSFGSKADKEGPGSGMAPGHMGVDLDLIKQDKNRWRVDTYLNEFLRPRMVRSVAHYDSRFLLSIFKQNHKNALIVQLGTLVFLLGLGYLMDYEVFRIPAGASIFILFGVLTAVVGAITYWLHRWRVTVLVLFILGLNSLTKMDWYTLDNRAYGMNYEVPAADYQFESLVQNCSKENRMADIQNSLQILQNWRARFGAEKPKLVVLAVSGGGLKATVWTMNVLQKADRLLDGKLMKHTMLMTGASGGLIGSAFFRELYLQKLEGKPIDPHDPVYLQWISKDLLNSVSFSIVSNDIFVPLTTFEYNGFTYIKDRGYAFERQLNENTRGMLNKPLQAYQLPEKQALIPMLIVSPSIINDARRLLISPQRVSYLTTSRVEMEGQKVSELDAIDFSGVFEKQAAGQLRFTTALRMNATYPYILPNVHLPSNPEIEVMDAGFRDNLGVTTASRYLQVFQDWIKENTSGVVLVQISSMKRPVRVQATDPRQGAFESLLNPLGILGHIIRLQDFERDANLGFIADILEPAPFEVLNFHYQPSMENDRASMTFHLTSREKNDIINALNLEENQKNLNRLIQILN